MSSASSTRPLIAPLPVTTEGHATPAEIWGQVGKNVLLSLGVAVGVYVVIRAVTRRVPWLADLSDVWAYDPSSTSLAIAAVAVTLFVATSLSDAWHAAAATDNRTFTRRMVTSNVTRFVFVLGAAVAWFAVLDVFTSPHHPVGVLVSVLVALLCCLLHVAQEDPRDLRTWRRAHLVDEVERLRTVVAGYSQALGRVAPGRRVWWGPLAGVAAGLLVAIGVLVDGTPEALWTAVVAGLAACVQMWISGHDMVRARLEHLLHGRRATIDVVLTNLVGSTVFVTFAVAAFAAGYWGLGVGLCLAALVAPLLTAFGLRASAGFNQKVLALAEVRLGHSEGKLARMEALDDDDDQEDAVPEAIELVHTPRLSSAQYAHAAIGPAGARLVFLAGSCPLDERGRTVAVGDHAGQAAACLANLKVALAAAGARMQDVVSTRVLVASSSRADLVAAWDVVREAFGDHDVPSTLFGVTVLGYDEQLVEIEAVAALPDR